MKTISYLCTSCNENYVINFEDNIKHSSEVPNQSKDKKLIPSPSKKNELKILYQNHRNHTIKLEISDELAIISKEKIKRIYTIFDTLVESYFEVIKIVNTLLSSKNNPKKYLLLFISNVDHYKIFFSSLIKKYVQEHQETNLSFQENILSTEQSHLKFALTNPEEAILFLSGSKKHKSIIGDSKDFILKSIVMDIGVLSEDELIQKLVKSKVKISSSTRVIVAFDTQMGKIPPLNLREFIENKYRLDAFDLLNYQDTNGLRSIILHSFFNLLDDPAEGRDVFEILSTNH